VPSDSSTAKTLPGAGDYPSLAGTVLVDTHPYFNFSLPGSPKVGAWEKCSSQEVPPSTTQSSIPGIS